MRGLKDKVAIITGAAGGIGKALCKRFLEEGVQVIATDVNREGLEQLAEDLKPAGGKLDTQVLDITDLEAVTKCIDHVVETFGSLEILINNAGWDVAMPFVDTEPELWNQIVNINLMGPLNMHKAVLPVMMKQGQGKIVNIASDAARVGSSGESVYAACKGGIVSFSKTLAREQARSGILVNVVCPGPTDTPLLQSFVGEGEFGQKIYDGLKRAIPLKRLGEPDDIPGIVVFLSSSDADFITGQVISVSGGLTMHG